jgi:hypothetical protein
MVSQQLTIKKIANAVASTNRVDAITSERLIVRVYSAFRFWWLISGRTPFLFISC